MARSQWATLPAGLRRLVPIACLTLALAAAGCGPSTVEPDMSIVGNYVLEAVDGKELPAVIFETSLGEEMAVSEGLFQIFASQTCWIAIRYTVTSPGGTDTQDQTLQCSWSGSPSSLTFTYTGGTRETGSVEEDLLSVNAEEVVYTFRKQ